MKTIASIFLEHRQWLRSLLVCTLLGLAFQAQAQFKISASFRNASQPGWSITGTDNPSTNDDSGILTGGYGIISATSTNDVAGLGWLRLTTKLNSQVGQAIYTGGTIPPALGIVVELEYISWGGSGADGLSVFLFDSAGTMAGALAGAGLGYCNGNGGYIGIGLDEFGNYSSPSAVGACSGGGPGNVPDSVAVRGPLTASNAYVGGAVVGAGIDDPGAASRGATNRLRYFLVPNGSGGYRVSVAYGANGSAPTPLLNGMNFPYTAPALLRLGLAGSTGGANNIHEVRDLNVSAPADIVVTKAVSAPTVLRGRTVSYTVTVQNKDINPFDAGDQSPPIDASNAPDLTDNLPAELTNVSWTCSASAGSTCPAASGVGNIGYSGGYTLASGGQLSFTITATVASSAACGATVSNTASAVFSDADGFMDIHPDDNTATASFVVECPTLQISKSSVGGTGAFSFGGSNGVSSHVVTTVSDGVSATGAVQFLLSAGTSTTVSETIPPGYTVTAIACSNLGPGGTAIPVLATGSVTLDAAATLTNGLISCAFTNTRTSITLEKLVPNGRRNAGDQFTLTISGPGGPSTATTSGSGNVATSSAYLPATVGAVYTVSEGNAGSTVVTDYTATYNCTNSRIGGQAPSGIGTTFNVTPVLGDNLLCSFTNTTVPYSDLRVSKTASTTAVQTGSIIGYTIIATNNGPDAANGSTLRDTPGPGLDCNQPSGVASCSATGGASCPAATIPVASLNTPIGVSLPSFPPGGSVTLLFQCKVTATGS